MLVRVGVVVMLAAAAALTVVGCGVGGSLETPGAVTGIIGPDGGRLESGGLTLVVPPGAVPAPTEFVMAPVTAAQLAVAPPNGLALLSGGQFEVNGVNTFATPVSITFPLSRRLPADSRVPLWQFYNGVEWRITDAPFAPVDAQVSPDWRSATTTAVRHFTVYAILADYAPFSEGASWTYNRIIETTPAGGLPNPPDLSTVVATITGTETVGGLSTYVWSEKDEFDNPVQTLYFHRSASAPYELLLVAMQEEEQALEVLSPPAKVLMLPPAPGQTWEVTTGLFDTTAQAAVTAETITVGAKEYDTMKVHIAPPSGGYMDIWWAPDVGPVKRKQSFVEPGVGTVVIEMDLQSYHLP
jgi:hypothetical protein